MGGLCLQSRSRSWRKVGRTRATDELKHWTTLFLVEAQSSVELWLVSWCGFSRLRWPLTKGCPPTI